MGHPVKAGEASAGDPGWSGRRTEEGRLFRVWSLGLVRFPGSMTSETNMVLLLLCPLLRVAPVPGVPVLQCSGVVGSDASAIGAPAQPFRSSPSGNQPAPLKHGGLVIL